ncbi:hypothetical protein K0M31_014499 [Melipona bicolor]|uniref:Uncharacterized protein n=1 Tax=Melipona bicolor TaxID=60889 RepID=A0AA40G9F6_9HYME|nr:hypothetical protein K0M31_014499 [Melipona bicolor]
MADSNDSSISSNDHNFIELYSTLQEIWRLEGRRKANHRERESLLLLPKAISSGARCSLRGLRQKVLQERLFPLGSVG